MTKIDADIKKLFKKNPVFDLKKLQELNSNIDKEISDEHCEAEAAKVFGKVEVQS